MPYRTQEELDDDMEKNPKLARMRVAKAKSAGLPVVSKNNPGYGKSRKDPGMEAAVRRRMAAYKPVQQKKPEEDPLAAKRKRVGY